MRRINKVDRKRVIKGFKTFGKKTAFKAGKYGLKGLLKIPELAVRGGASAIGALSDSEQFQVIATTGGLVVASVACPPVALGVASVVAGKYLADKILGKVNDRFYEKGIFDEVRETILLGNKVTKLACQKVISPTMHYVGTKAQTIGKAAQDKADNVFDGR